MDSFANLCEKILAEAVLVRRVEKLLGSDILSKSDLSPIFGKASLSLSAKTKIYSSQYGSPVQLCMMVDCSKYPPHI